MITPAVYKVRRVPEEDAQQIIDRHEQLREDEETRWADRDTLMFEIAVFAYWVGKASK